MKLTKFAPSHGSVSTKYAGEKSRWQAVVRRDLKADGQFYYAVKSTGVYCRPSCGARLPLRQNVAFFDTQDEAKRSGFRPCKRCQPQNHSSSGTQAAAIASACENIRTRLENELSLDTLAKSVGMSKFHFHRLFTKTVGLTPKAFAKAERARRLRGELSKHRTVTEAMYQAGFNSSGRFYAESTQTLGMRPKQYQQKGRGETIHYAIGKGSLGFILVAMSGKGVCALSLGDRPADLVRDLQQTFSQAKQVSRDRTFAQILATVIAHVEAPHSKLNLPLDLRGTVFQHRVWNLLARISPGHTSSYSAIAQQLGQPKATRAVARACAANPVALAIPCHRVLRSNGKLSGYRWGIERKRILLQKEGVKIA